MNIRIIVLFIGLLILCAVETPVNEAPSTDPDNGGLTLPQGLGALAVADSAGPARLLAANTNGDIYIKLRIDAADRGNMALRGVDLDVSGHF
jgi:hypothetical protein